MRPEILTYIAVMALVTYLIRLLPLTLIRRRITNKYIRSFCTTCRMRRFPR